MSVDHRQLTPALPYEPMPENKFLPIRDALLDRSFSLNSIRTNFPFTSPNKSRMQLNCVAFADELRWDTDTSSVAVYYNSAGDVADHFALQEIAVSGAPMVLIAKADSVSLFKISANGKLEGRLVRPPIAYKDIHSVFEQYARDINPRRILDVKHGLANFETPAFADIDPLQLRLWAIEATRAILADQFGSAVNAIRRELKRQKAKGVPATYLDTRLATMLLGAIILAHKGRLGSDLQSSSASLDKVLSATEERFKGFLDLQLFGQYQSAIESAYSILNQVIYSNATPDILDELYIRAYPAHRKSEGRYATPLYLTNRILQNIPIEFIRPSDRLVADIACGWGSFLITAYERLSRISDMSDSGRNPREHLYGNDYDPFTAELAQLALLLTAFADHWHIDSYDVLGQSKASSLLPTIIVGNPPFKGGRKEGTREQPTGELEPKRSQKADKFLEAAIRLLQPGGYLAMLLPQSFGVSEASAATRRLLLENCDVQEIWELPTAVFRGEATVSLMVLFAQKLGQTETGPVTLPVRTRMLQNQDKDNFVRQGIFTTSGLVGDQSSWNIESKKSEGSKVTHQMNYYLILSEREWAEIQAGSIPCVRVAKFFAGAIKGKTRPHANYRNPQEVSWLDSASDIEPFRVHYSAKTIRYPNELHWPRLGNRKLLARSKVLMVALPNMSWGKRTIVAIERRGYYASHNFWVIVPRDGRISLEVLAAVLGWDVSNAWIIEGLKEPWIRKQTLQSIPFPKLTDADSRLLESAVLEIEQAVDNDRAVDRANRVIDEILTKAYGLTEAVFRRLRIVMEWDEYSPHVDIATLHPGPASVFRVSGEVQSVNMTKGKLTLWFDGIPDTRTVPIVGKMPGWMLRAGAAFRAEVSADEMEKENWDSLGWWNIRPKEYTYLAEDELLARIAQELAPA